MPISEGSQGSCRGGWPADFYHPEPCKSFRHMDASGGSVIFVHRKGFRKYELLGAKLGRAAYSSASGGTN